MKLKLRMRLAHINLGMSGRGGVGHTLAIAAVEREKVNVQKSRSTAHRHGAGFHLDPRTDRQGGSVLHAQRLRHAHRCPGLVGLTAAVQKQLVGQSGASCTYGKGRQGVGNGGRASTMHRAEGVGHVRRHLQTETHHGTTSTLRAITHRAPAAAPNHTVTLAVCEEAEGLFQCSHIVRVL